MRPYRAALLGVGLTFGIIGQASASLTCTGAGIFNSANGTATDPGTFVGTVGAGGTCQIGAVDPPATSASAAEVNPATDPSNYEFYFASGNLTIEEEIGASSFGNIDAELASWNGSTATLVPGTSIQIIASTTSPSAEYVLLNDQYLAAGDYIVSTYCSNNGCITGDGTAVDPQFQVNFAVPEPSSLAVLVASLAGAAAFFRRRKARDVPGFRAAIVLTRPRRA